jgi:hypothetical protein
MVFRDSGAFGGDFCAWVSQTCRLLVMTVISGRPASIMVGNSG